MPHAHRPAQRRTGRSRLATAFALAAVLVVSLMAGFSGTATAHGDRSHLPPGLPTKVTWLPEDLRLDGAGLAWRVEYTSTSFDGTSTMVGGTITFPTGPPPAGGWPVAAVLPGAGGVADSCAPSQVGMPPFAQGILEATLDAGWAVVITDFEGVGMPDEHPGVHGPSETYSIIDLVRTARHFGLASDTWAAVGYSQGGHGALFASALAADYAPELDHVGTVALAPFTQPQLLFNAPGGDDPAAPVNVFMPYMGHALAITHPEVYDPADWFTPLGLDLVAASEELCTEQMAAETATLTNGEVFIDPPAALAFMSGLFADQEIPVVGHTRPILIAHGTADAIPWELSDLTATQLAAAGADVEFVPITDADHFTVLQEAIPLVTDWLADQT